ncbi:uncharacterized protein L201_005750 [Kwoniella dendrophila CBS 6074]|uniref:Uncharacterized protein n=1 Tax=Kwoniella dendrophila CBS 6074 TaxID=1295534 RepID=A0AAX4K170_9TREE
MPEIWDFSAEPMTTEMDQSELTKTKSQSTDIGDIIQVTILQDALESAVQMDAVMSDKLKAKQEDYDSLYKEHDKLKNGLVNGKIHLDDSPITVELKEQIEGLVEVYNDIMAKKEEKKAIKGNKGKKKQAEGDVTEYVIMDRQLICQALEALEGSKKLIKDQEEEEEEKAVGMISKG